MCHEDSDEKKERQEIIDAMREIEQNPEIDRVITDCKRGASKKEEESEKSKKVEGNRLLQFNKKDPREDWENMKKSLTDLDRLIIEDAVIGEQARNLRALGLVPEELENFSKTGKYAQSNWDCALGGG